jgi:murein DD-endopeptidase MepM/ murein hydrolase activator NlpD
MNRFKPSCRAMTVLLSIFIVLISYFRTVVDVHAADPDDDGGKPFGMPFAGDPSPDTWLFLQPYGNTLFAYQYRSSVYFGGQGLHFGVDLEAACGTPILAIGDGVVESVDSWHGAGPHNLMISHPNGYDSFYGHLLVRPRLRVGQSVEKGQEVALSGDPDLTCNSRPHLHLEIRDSATQGIAYNPLELIDADWERIALAGSEPVAFVQELGQPRVWVGLYDQPETKFGYPLVNDFARAWPYDW